MAKVFDEFVLQAGSREAVIQKLTELYGWDEETFKRKILKLVVLEEELSKKLVNDPNFNADKLRLAEEIKKELQGGADFALLAKGKSEDPGSAARGGDLGFFGHGMMVPEFEDAAFALKPGEISDVIKSPYGFHIIKVEDVKSEKKVVKEVRARHILIRFKSLDEFINEKLAAAKVYRLLKVPSAVN